MYNDFPSLRFFFSALPQYFRQGKNVEDKGFKVWMGVSPMGLHLTSRLWIFLTYGLAVIIKVAFYDDWSARGGHYRDQPLVRKRTA